MSAFSVAAILRSPDIQAVTQAAARDLNLRASVASGFTAATLRTLEGDVLLVDIDVRNTNEMRALQDFVASERKPVVVTSPHLDIASMRELLHMGISDVVLQPVIEEELTAALRNAATRLRTQRSAAPGGVVSFLKSCGGVGATTLVVQAACALGRGKKPAVVSVLDFDLQFGAAALQTDAEQRISLLDLVRAPERLDGTLLNGAMVRPHDRFYLLAAPRDVVGIDDIDPHAVASVVNMARSQYAATLIDLPLMWAPLTHAALAASDTIVLVTQFSVPALRQARRQIDTIKREGLGDIPLKLVANRVKGGFFSNSAIGRREAEKALGRNVDFTVADDDAFSLAANSGAPLSEISGGASLERKIAQMMGNILPPQAAHVQGGGSYAVRSSHQV